MGFLPRKAMQRRGVCALVSRFRLASFEGEEKRSQKMIESRKVHELGPRVCYLCLAGRIAINCYEDKRARKGCKEGGYDGW